MVSERTLSLHGLTRRASSERRRGVAPTHSPLIRKNEDPKLIRGAHRVLPLTRSTICAERERHHATPD